MEINLTKEQLQLLLQIILNINWSGQQVEEAVELKKIIKEAIEKT